MTIYLLLSKARRIGLYTEPPVESQRPSTILTPTQIPCYLIFPPHKYMQGGNHHLLKSHIEYYLIITVQPVLLQ